METSQPIAREKAWLKQPGQVLDLNDVPIYPGDLLRSLHFVAGRKRYYLYHTAVFCDGAMWMVPTSHLERTKISGGGRCLLSDDLARFVAIIHGAGPKPYLSYEDRPKGMIDEGYYEK